MLADAYRHSKRIMAIIVSFTEEMIEISNLLKTKKIQKNISSIKLKSGKKVRTSFIEHWHEKRKNRVGQVLHIAKAVIKMGI